MFVHIPSSVNAEEKKAKKRQYYLDNKDQILATMKAYRERDPSVHLAKKKAYRDENAAKVAAGKKRHYEANKEATLAKCREYRTINRDARNAQQREWKVTKRKELAAKQSVYHKKRMKADPSYKLVHTLRRRVSLVLLGIKKSAATMDLVGCTVEFAKLHIESKFLPGMTWDNHGEWHVDHKRPCASFDLADPAQQRECFHYSNLQPLWARDNCSKGARY